MNWSRGSLVLCYIVVVCTTVGDTEAEEEEQYCLEGDVPLLNGSLCAYLHGTPLDWENAVQLCTLFGTEMDLVDVTYRAGNEAVEKFLHERNLTSVWIAANQPVRNRLLEYQLPRRHGVFPLQRFGRIMPHDIQWSFSRPEGYCVILKTENVTGISLHMRLCSERHSAVYITYSSLYAKQSVRVREDSLAKMHHPDPEPTLHFRYDKETNKLFLSVYHPERMNPETVKCYLHGAPLGKDNTVQLTYMRVSAEFLVSTEEEGYITCQVRVWRSLQLVKTERFLRRSSEEGQTYVVLTIHEDEETFSDYFMSDPPVDLDLVENLTRRMHDKLMPRMQVDSVHVIGFRYGEGVRYITYRVHLPQQYVKDLSPFIRSIISLDRETAAVRVRSAEYCPDENKDGLTWPATSLGQSTVSITPCRYSDGRLNSRQCGGNFIDGAYWDDPELLTPGCTCDAPLKREEQIQQLTRTNVSDGLKLKLLQNALLTLPRVQLNVSEIKGISEIFSYISADGLSDWDVPIIASITNDILLLSMNGSASSSQEEFNTSNSILASLDNLLGGVDLVSDRASSGGRTLDVFLCCSDKILLSQKFPSRASSQ